MEKPQGLKSIFFSLKILHFAGPIWVDSFEKNSKNVYFIPWGFLEIALFFQLFQTLQVYRYRIEVG